MVFHCMALRITENVPKLWTAFLRQPWPIEELCRSSPQTFCDFCDPKKNNLKKMKLWHSFGQTTSGGLCFGRLELWRSQTKFGVVGIFVCSDSCGARSKGLWNQIDSFPTFPRLDIWWTSTMVVSFHGLRALTWNQHLNREIIRYRGDLSRFMPFDPFGLLWAGPNERMLWCSLWDLFQQVLHCGLNGKWIIHLY